MLFQIAYWMFFVSTIAFSWHLGGRDGRVFVAAIILATLCTLGSYQVLGLNDAVILVLLIDSALLIVVASRALTSQQFWPLWFAALQLASVLTTIAAILAPAEIEGIYQNLVGFWAIPAMFVMFFGIRKDHKFRATAQ